MIKIQLLSGAAAYINPKNVGAMFTQTGGYDKLPNILYSITVFNECFNLKDEEEWSRILQLVQEKNN